MTKKTLLGSSTHLSGGTDPLKDDFKTFLFMVWTFLNLPEPTRSQYVMAEWLQTGPEKLVIEAFRGIGKSWVTAAYVCWLLYRDPQLKIMVVSASKIRADDFSTFTLRLIEEMGEVTAHLKPRPNQRNSKIAFDVGPAPLSHAPSVTSKGITSTLTGGRADLIIPDDIITAQNSQTQASREKISILAEEFNAVLKPGGRIMFLGTPQSEQDLLHELPAKDYRVRIWPAEVPSPKVALSQGDRLAPMIQAMIANGVPPGTPTDPLRFDEEDLEKRRMGYGRTGYAMQFLLDQSLADMERYPLRLNDLIVDDLDKEFCHEKYVWANDPALRWEDPPCPGFNGDFWHRPMQRVGVGVRYSSVVMAIDPSGRGSDETAYAVVACYGGQLFVLDAGGLQGGYGPEVLDGLVAIAKANGVKRIVVEENFGQGMFEALLRPVIVKNYPCNIETVRHNRQKEMRICDVLEPVMNSHRLIVDRKVWVRDWETVKDYAPDLQKSYLLSYQLSRITRDRGALAHDDRLDALAMAVQFWVNAAAQDADTKMDQVSEDRRRRALERFMANAVSMTKPPEPRSTEPCWFQDRPFA